MYYIRLWSGTQVWALPIIPWVIADGAIIKQALRHLLFQIFQQQIKHCNKDKQYYNILQNVRVKTVLRLQPLC